MPRWHALFALLKVLNSVHLTGAFDILLFLIVQAEMSCPLFGFSYIWLSFIVSALPCICVLFVMGSWLRVGAPISIRSCGIFPECKFNRKAVPQLSQPSVQWCWCLIYHTNLPGVQFKVQNSPCHELNYLWHLLNLRNTKGDSIF